MVRSLSRGRLVSADNLWNVSHRGRGKNPSWTGGKAILSEVGSIQMEFLYLAKAARNASFAEKPSGVMDVLDQQGKINGLYPIYLDGHSGKLSTSCTPPPPPSPSSLFSLAFFFSLLLCRFRFRSFSG